MRRFISGCVAAAILAVAAVATASTLAS